MKKTLFALVTGLALAACSQDTAAPLDQATSNLLDDAAELAYNASYAADPGSNLLPGINRLPDNLKLTADQQAKIKALVDAFTAATKADRDALVALPKGSDAANAIRTRLQAAETKLKADLLAVLTAEQRAWVESHNQKDAPPSTCPSLTDAQKTQIAALIAAYEQANKADIETTRTALERAQAAKRAGKTEAEIKAILDAARAATDRLRAATDKLNSDIQALLTPEQKSASCFRLPKAPTVGAPPAAPGRSK